jgi:hypothetical protein
MRFLPTLSATVGALSVVVLSCIATEALAQNLAGQVLQNDSGRDFPILTLSDSHNVPFAKLYIAKGHKMAWDKTGDQVVYGAGYFDALPNNYYYVPTLSAANGWIGGLGGLHVSRIDWDDDGKTTSISYYGDTLLNPLL